MFLFCYRYKVSFNKPEQAIVFPLKQKIIQRNSGNPSIRKFLIKSILQKWILGHKSVRRKSLWCTKLTQNWLSNDLPITQRLSIINTEMFIMLYALYLTCDSYKKFKKWILGHKSVRGKNLWCTNFLEPKISTRKKSWSKKCVWKKNSNP